MTDIKTLIEDGREYQSLWPKQKALAVIFPEPKIIKLSLLLQKTVPMIACMNFVAQFLYFGEEIIPRALAMSLLVLSIPYQSLMWLGYRSKQPLPVGLITWCSNIQTQMVNAGVSVTPISPRACYKDMARLLNEAYSKLNKAFELP